jgi:SAM-dependent methyltransferase
MNISPSLIRRAKALFLRTQPKYGYAMVYERGRIPLLVWYAFRHHLIICNFCGTVFERAGHDHSESLHCPLCDTIARERVAYQCILDELNRASGSMYKVFSQVKELHRLMLLECSPRVNDNRRHIYEAALGRYVASDFAMHAHRADLKLDLANEEDIQPVEGACNIIICAHVLEHIPDYHLALKNLSRLLAPGGFLVLQVPVLEASYVKVTWDEFHQDDARVYHRFGFDLTYELDRHFSQVKAVTGLLDFEITSPEINPDKYELLKQMRQRVTILGDRWRRRYGLGSPDLCDAFVAYK